VFVMARSADLAIVSESVAELLPGVGSVTPAGAVTVAVFVRVPVAAALMLADTVYVTLPPDGRFTVVSLMLPLPLAVQVPPPAPTQVQVAVRLAGKVSATVTPLAFEGPALLAVIVYVTEPPAVAVVTPSVFVIARSAVLTIVSLSV